MTLIPLEFHFELHWYLGIHQPKYINIFLEDLLIVRRRSLTYRLQIKSYLRSRKSLPRLGLLYTFRKYRLILGSWCIY